MSNRPGNFLDARLVHERRPSTSMLWDTLDKRTKSFEEVTVHVRGYNKLGAAFFAHDFWL